MKAYWLGLKFMFSYFTILPVRFAPNDNLNTPAILASMLLFLPLGGLVTGGMALLLYQLFVPLEWVAGVVAGLGYMMLYGFLHTEAIMDVADALYAKHAGKDAFSVIKESTVGAMGVLWAVSLLILKLSLIVLLLGYEAYSLFLATLIVSRLGLLVLFATQTFRSSFIRSMQEGFTTNYLLASFVLFGGIGLVVAQWHFVVLLLTGVPLSYLVATTLGKKLGFINGDVLGTTLEVTEILLFTTGAMLWL